MLLGGCGHSGTIKVEWLPSHVPEGAGRGQQGQVTPDFWNPWRSGFRPRPPSLSLSPQFEARPSQE